MPRYVSSWVKMDKKWKKCILKRNISPSLRCLFLQIVYDIRFSCLWQPANCWTTVNFTSQKIYSNFVVSVAQWAYALVMWKISTWFRANWMNILLNVCKQTHEMLCQLHPSCPKRYGIYFSQTLLQWQRKRVIFKIRHTTLFESKNSPWIMVEFCWVLYISGILFFPQTRILLRRFCLSFNEGKTNIENIIE